ncbi:hypothetical protein RDABS01_040116, partial [Bienertia sinuspersici]
MDGLFEAGQLVEALDVFSLLVDKGLQPNVYSYTIIKDAENLFKKMEDNGCSPDECTFNTIIRGFLDVRILRGLWH